MAKKTVFITGGTGNMGWAAVQEMLKKPDQINIKMLARKSKKNEELLQPLLSKPNLKIIWGDLLDTMRFWRALPALIMCCTLAAWYPLLRTGSLTEHRKQISAPRRIYAKPFLPSRTKMTSKFVT